MSGVCPHPISHSNYKSKGYGFSRAVKPKRLNCLPAQEPPIPHSSKSCQALAIVEIPHNPHKLKPQSCGKITGVNLLSLSKIESERRLNRKAAVVTRQAAFLLYPNTAQTATKYSFQRISTLNLCNQYFGNKPHPYPTDSKDSGIKQGEGERVHVRLPARSRELTHKSLIAYLFADRGPCSTPPRCETMSP